MPLAANVGDTDQRVQVALDADSLTCSGQKDATHVIPVLTCKPLVLAGSSPISFLSQARAGTRNAPLVKSGRLPEAASSRMAAPELLTDHDG